MARVLHVVLSLGPGGAERLVIDLCQRLRDEFEPAVCCLDEPGSWEDRLVSVGVEVSSLARRPGFHPWLARGIAAHARRFRADVLHCHEYSPFVYGTLAQILLPHLRVISTEHGRLSDARATLKRRFGTRVITRLPATIYAVSADLRGRLVQEGFPAHRVRVIRNGVDPGRESSGRERVLARTALSLGQDELVIGAVGRLARVKDFRTLVSAAGILQSRGVRARVVILGEGPERSALEAQIRAERLEPVVALPGYRDDVRALLPAFDVFVNCSTYEGISLTVLEAMATGLPIVATRVGGNPELVDEGTSGTLVPAGSPEALAAAVGALLRDETRRQAFGEQGRRRVRQAFDVRRMVAEYADAYRGIGTV